MLIIECINKKEFQANRGKFNVIGLYKLSLHLAKPLLYTITGTFLHFHTLPMNMPRTDRQADAAYYFHSNVYFLTVDMPKMPWLRNGYLVPMSNRDSSIRVENLYPFQPYHMPQRQLLLSLNNLKRGSFENTVNLQIWKNSRLSLI